MRFTVGLGSQYVCSKTYYRDDENGVPVYIDRCEFVAEAPVVVTPGSVPESRPIESLVAQLPVSQPALPLVSAPPITLLSTTTKSDSLSPTLIDTGNAGGNMTPDQLLTNQTTATAATVAVGTTSQTTASETTDHTWLYLGIAAAAAYFLFLRR